MRVVAEMEESGHVLALEQMSAGLGMRGSVMKLKFLLCSSWYCHWKSHVLR